MRVLGIPVWLAWYALDLRAAAHLVGGATSASAALRVLRVLSPCVQLFLWILSCVWFKRLTAGMLKALRGDADKERSKRL